MRFIKMFGLAATAAVAAMAFVGATSASATDTQLCTAHDALTCDAGEAATTVSVTNAGQGPGVLLTSWGNILCLTIEGSASLLGLANPQAVHITSLSFTNCGDGGHENLPIDGHRISPLADTKPPQWRPSDLPIDD